MNHFKLQSLQKAYEKIIERLGSSFDLSNDIIERSKELFGILYKADGFYCVAVENKKIIAGRIHFEHFLIMVVTSVEVTYLYNVNLFQVAVCLLCAG